MTNITTKFSKQTVLLTTALATVITLTSPIAMEEKDFTDNEQKKVDTPRPTLENQQPIKEEDKKPLNTNPNTPPIPPSDSDSKQIKEEDNKSQTIEKIEIKEIIKEKNISEKVFDHVKIYQNKNTIDDIQSKALKGNTDDAAFEITQQIKADCKKINSDKELIEKGLMKEDPTEKHKKSIEFYHNFGQIILSTCHMMIESKKKVEELNEFFNNSIELTNTSYKDSSGEGALKRNTIILDLKTQRDELNKQYNNTNTYLTYLFAPYNTSNFIGFGSITRKTDRKLNTGVFNREALTEDVIYKHFEDVSSKYYEKITNNKGDITSMQEELKKTYLEEQEKYIKEQHEIIEKNTINILTNRYHKEDVPEDILSFLKIEPKKK